MPGVVKEGCDVRNILNRPSKTKERMRIMSKER